MTRQKTKRTSRGGENDTGNASLVSGSSVRQRRKEAPTRKRFITNVCPGCRLRKHTTDAD